MPIKSAMQQLSEGLVTCVILYLDTGYVFAAAAAISSVANFEEVVLSVPKMSKSCRYVVHIVLGFQLKGAEVTSVHCERHCFSEGGARALGQSGTCWEDENAPGVGF